MELVKIPTNVEFVDFSGYVLIAITALLMFYVIPHVFRRRSVLAEARIEERYAEELRMLDVNASRSGGASTHTGGPTWNGFLSSAGGHHEEERAGTFAGPRY